MSMKSMRLLGRAGLLGLLALAAGSAQAVQPAYGGGIVVDGFTSDWNLASDYAADMYNAGRSDTGWPGFAVLSRLYLRYDCDTKVLYALVLDVQTDNQLPVASAGDAWLKLYSVGLPANKLIDGSGNGGTTPRSFAWVYSMPSDPNSPLLGYEACAQLDEGAYTDFEAHLNVGGNTSSTGKYSQGNAVPLNILCLPEEPTVGAVDQPGSLELGPACPNPFNPTTSLSVTLTETGPASLRVYDVSGRQVSTLFDGLQAAGTRRIQFQAGALPSGLYLVVLSSAGESATQKLLLLK